MAWDRGDQFDQIRVHFEEEKLLYLVRRCLIWKLPIDFNKAHGYKMSI